MAVKRTPWSSTTTFTDLGAPAPRVVGKTTATKPKVTVDPTDPFAAFRGNKAELDKAVRSTIDRIAEDKSLLAQPRAEKEKMVQQVLDIAYGGKDKPDKPSGLFGLAKSAAARVLGGPALGALGAYAKYIGPVQRTVQSAAVEVSDSFVTALNMLNPVDKWDYKGDFTPRWSDFTRQIADEDWGIYKDNGSEYKFGNSKLNAISQFVADVASDPTTYVGVGATANIGKAGRMALAGSIVDNATVAKYPILQQLGKEGLDTLANDIARYGASAIPKVVRQGEGIQMGLRYAGAIIPKTEFAEQAFAKTAGALRAGIGDVVYNPNVASKIGQVGRLITPRSQRSAVAAGVGRKGALVGNVRDEIALWTATKYMKGATAAAYQAAVQNVVDFAQRQNELMGRGIKGRLSNVYEPEAANLYRYIEMSDAELAAQPVRDELKQLVRDVKNWQDSLRVSTNQTIRQFGDDFSTTVRQIGFVDDYIHHQLTPEAKNWLNSESGRRFLNNAERGIRSVDVMSKDITNPQSPLMFRKLRGQIVDPVTGKVTSEKFFGVDVVTGKIDEINDIFRQQTNQQFDWFETDFAKVADSYAYSMAKAKGRVSYARRLMDFGHDDLIKPLIKKHIPDPDLVARLTDVHDRTMLVRERLRARIASNLQKSKNYAETARNFAANFLKGELKSVKMSEKQYRDLASRLDDALIKLAGAHAAATAKEAALRGEFGQFHQILMDEVTALRGGINDPDRFAATEELKGIYMQIFPNHNPTLLDSKSPEWIAEKILHANGVPATREVKVVNRQLRELRKAIDEIPDGAEYDEIRQTLSDEYYDLEQVEQAYSGLGQVRMDADYSPDGFMYGTVDDLIPLPEGEVYKVFRTSPERAFGDGFRELPEGVAVHAVPSGALLDMRRPKDFRYVMSDQGILDGIADAMYRRGLQLESEGLREQAARFFANGDFDPQWEEAYPEMANLIATVKLYGASEGDDLLSDVTLTSSLYEVEEALRTAIPVEDYQDLDIFAREIMNEALGRVNQKYDAASGLLLPQGWYDDLNEAVADYVVMVDPSFKTAKPSLNPNSEAQFVNSNPFVQGVMDGRYEEMSLEASLAKTSKEEELIQLENSQVLLSDLKGQVKSASGKKGGLTRAAKARVTKTQQALETLRRTDSIEIVQGGKKVTITRDQAQRALLRGEQKLVNAYKALQKDIDAVYARAGVSRDLATGSRVDKITDIHNRLPMLFNQAEVLRTWSETTGQTLAKDIQDMSQLLKSAPPKGAAAGESLSWVKKVERTIQEIGGFQDPATAQAYDRVTTLLHADEAQLAMLEAISIPAVEQDLFLATAGALGPKMIEVTEKGWQEIYGLGVQVPDEVLDVWLPNLRQLNDKTVVAKLKKAYFEMMNFFKVYATSTVGFFVRNGMSATFMNFVAGVSTDNIQLGVRAAHAIQKGPDAWAKFLSKQTPEMAQNLEVAYRATLATGRGVSDQLSGIAIRGKGTERIINNRYTRFYQRKNEGVELAVRLPMAIDSIVRGQNYDQAVARISRYHFDYSDLSELDEAAKALVPFWIWTSRNVPLQIVEQWTNPRAYSIYEDIKQGSPVDDRIMMPKWIADWKPAALGGVNAEGGQWVLTPDVPINQLDKQLQALVDPRRLVGSMAPVVKVPIELIAGRQLGIDVGPFKEKKQQAQGLDELLAQLASIVGGENLAVKDPQTGEWMLDERIPYIVQNALPFLGQINRVTGGLTGGKPSYQERQLGNIANWFGVPTRYVGPQQQSSEAVGRQFEIRDLIAQWIEQGKLTKKR